MAAFWLWLLIASIISTASLVSGQLSSAGEAFAQDQGLRGGQQFNANRFFAKGPIGSGLNDNEQPGASVSVMAPGFIQPGQAGLNAGLQLQGQQDLSQGIGRPEVGLGGFQNPGMQQPGMMTGVGADNGLPSRNFASQPVMGGGPWAGGADKLTPGVDTNMIGSASAYGGPGGTYGGGQDSGYESGGPNAGYGGYPGRGGFSGYWEPGVKPVPLAQQGWGLFIPRPPVEITTPTTTKPPPTTAPPAYSYGNYGGYGQYPIYATTKAPTPAPTPAPTTTTTTTAAPVYSYMNYQPGTYLPYPIYETTTTTKAPTPAPTTTTTTTAAPVYYYMNYQPSSWIQYPTTTPTTTTKARTTTAYSSSVYNSGNTANKQLPVMFDQMNKLAVDEAGNPLSCVPDDNINAKGICVDEALLQATCENMIVSHSATCLTAQWCCFSD